MAEDQNDPVLRIGGDASGAEAALKNVRTALTQTAATAKTTGTSIKSSFGGLTSVFSTLFNGLKSIGSFVGSLVRGGINLLIAAYQKLKYVVIGVVGALGASYYAWDKEAKAQARLDSLLKSNVKNYKAAGAEISKLIARTQRTTNFGDDDVRGVIGNFIRVRGGKGMQDANKLLPGILDFAAATGEDPGGISFAIARALATGNVSMLRRQGLMVDAKAFKRDPYGAIGSVINERAGGAAADQRQAAPLTALLGSLGEVMESLGSIVAQKVNPYIERFANVAYSVAETLGSMRFDQFMEMLKLSLLDAFDYIRLYTAAFFEWVKQNWPMITATIEKTFQTVGEKIIAFFKSKEFSDALGAAIKGVGAAAGGALGGPKSQLLWKNMSPWQKLLYGDVALLGQGLGWLSGRASPVSAAGMGGATGGSGRVFGGGAINKSVMGGAGGGYGASPYTTVASTMGLSNNGSYAGLGINELAMLMAPSMMGGRQFGSSRALDYWSSLQAQKSKQDAPGLQPFKYPSFKQLGAVLNGGPWVNPLGRSSYDDIMNSATVLGVSPNGGYPRGGRSMVSTYGTGEDIGKENDVVSKLMQSANRRTDALAIDRRRGAMTPAY